MRIKTAQIICNPRVWLGLCAVLLANAPLQTLDAAGADGPKNATVLLIRHAEKVEDGDGLAPAGVDRAKAYVKYFQELTIQSQIAKPAALIATADSKGSHRPRLTLEPLSKALSLPIDARFKNKDYGIMVESLRSGNYDNKTTLICWHHGDMPEVLRALGVDVGTVIPGSKWPGEEYDWLIELQYDERGHLKSAQRVEEHLTVATAAH